jgi:urea carboxylase-associated protein 2
MKTPCYHDNQLLWDELIPGGHHWSARIQKGSLLEIRALGSHANLSCVLVNAQNLIEGFNMPDSLKAQHTAFLSQGHVLYSDLARVMASIVVDEHGWNDVLCGPSTPAQIAQHFGQRRFQDAQNAMYHNGVDSLLIEMSKFGLTRADLTASLNLYSKVVADAQGRLCYIDEDNRQQLIALRFEMDCLLFVSNTPHGLDPSPSYQPAAVQLALYRALPLAAQDVCRDSCPQNQRGFANNARYFALDH